MKRRIISICMVALLLLPAAFSAAATTPVTITSEDIQGNVGDTVTVTLNIAIDPPKLGQTMDSLQFVLEYNSAALEFVSIQEFAQDNITILGARYTCTVTTKAGAVAFAAASTDGASGSGALMHVRFKILSAARTMLVLKSVAYSFVTKNGKTQDRGLSGIINLGSITGKSAPYTVAPSSSLPDSSQEPANTPAATDEPRFPVTEVTLAPGASPTTEPAKTDNDILAYIVFILFIVVARLVCVVLTLMIVRRGKNRAKLKYFEDDEEDEGELMIPSEEDEPYEEAEPEENSYEDDPYEETSSEDEEDEPPIRIVRRSKK